MPTVQITAPPNFVSPEEHRNLIQSTPSSFADIPPVLRHKEEHVSVTLDPPLPNLPTEDLKGTLYVTESVVAFLSSAGPGFAIDYPSITLHAISRSGDGPSIYCQLDETPDGHVLAEDEENDMRELNIIPSDPASLEPIFEALSICAALHPDKGTASDDDMDGGAFDDADETGTGLGGGGGFETFTGAEGEELSQVGRAALDHLESIIVYPPSHASHAPVAGAVDGGVHSESSEEEETAGGTGLPNGTH